MSIHYFNVILYLSGLSEKSSNSVSNSDLSDVLVLPQVTQHKRKREAVNSRAKCVTDDDILGELKAKEQEKTRRKRKIKLKDSVERKKL